MAADSSKRTNLRLEDDEPVSTTRLATIDVDADVDDAAPTQRMVDTDPCDDLSGRPALQSPLPAFIPRAERGKEGPASLYPLDVAATCLHRTAHKLHGMIRSTARRAGIDLRVDSIVDLGGGVVAHKIGGQWFMKLPRR